LIALKITRVAPVFAALKPQLQYQNAEKSYSPKKRPVPTFESVLEKELQPKAKESHFVYLR
jgi:hypothetical protein